MSKRIEIIAEISANHGHDIDIAKSTIKAAKDAGADAVKNSNLYGGYDHH